MASSLIYEVRHKLTDGNTNYVYVNDKHKLLFNDVIAINPHNILISLVLFCSPHTNSFFTLYDMYGIRMNSIYAIKRNIIRTMNHAQLLKKEKDEILHLIDLWLTKFVDN